VISRFSSTLRARRVFPAFELSSWNMQLRSDTSCKRPATHEALLWRDVWRRMGDV
jgi:hypothetical protein